MMVKASLPTSVSVVSEARSDLREVYARTHSQYTKAECLRLCHEIDCLTQELTQHEAAAMAHIKRYTLQRIKAKNARPKTPVPSNDELRRIRDRLRPVSTEVEMARKRCQLLTPQLDVIRKHRMHRGDSEYVTRERMFLDEVYRVAHDIGPLSIFDTTDEDAFRDYLHDLSQQLDQDSLIVKAAADLNLCRQCHSGHLDRLIQRASDLGESARFADVLCEIREVASAIHSAQCEWSRSDMTTAQERHACCLKWLYSGKVEAVASLEEAELLMESHCLSEVVRNNPVALEDFTSVNLLYHSPFCRSMLHELLAP